MESLNISGNGELFLKFTLKSQKFTEILYMEEQNIIKHHLKCLHD